LKKPLTSLVFLLICSLFLINISIYEVTAEDVSNGAISIVFDDNYDNQYANAWPLMENRGIVGTFYVLTSTVNRANYMSYADLQMLQSAGNEIGSHSVSHTSFTLLEEQQIRDECLNSKVTLESNGLVISNFAYPNGYTTSGIDAIVGEYYLSGRTAYISPFMVGLPTDQFRLPAFSEEDMSNELDLLKNMVDQVQSSDSWGIFLFHKIVPGDYVSDYTTSMEDFETFLDYIIQKGVPTITINQGLDIVTLSMDTNAGSITPGNGEYVLGSEVVIEAIAPVGGVGERFVWEGWSGSGVGSYSGTDNPATITLNGNLNQAASWRHEYRLTTSSNHGQVEPSAGEHWYEANSEVVIEAIAPVGGVGERFVWEGWSGSGVGSYSGTDNPASIIMNNSISQVGSWDGQYQIFITKNGVGTDFTGNIMTINGVDYSNDHSLWVDSGSTLSFSFQTDLNVNEGKKYHWTTSSGLSSQQSGLIIASGSGSITANYKIQYFLEVISSYGNTTGSGWYDSNEIVYATIDNLIINDSENIRYVFSGWTEDGSGTTMTSDPIILNKSLLAVASWQKQYLITFNQEGLPIETDVSIVVNSMNHTLPSSIWFDEGTIVDFEYPDNITNGLGAQYILISSPDQTILTLNSPTNITSTYALQSISDMFIIGVILAIFICLIFAIIFLKRRNLI